MVLSENYRRQQIQIPDHLAVILKNYAKAVIRTQPYDLLRWSAAYFRCLALEQTPPTKLRYEKEEQTYGKVTKGYIQALVQQLGKGYFIKHEILLDKWQGLCLPEDQLYDFLSLTRMLHWQDVHWLKFISVLIGSMCDNFEATMEMICEVLTDEPEGSPAPIPMWMFRVCYKFLAELDCSEEQVFVDGRKLLSENVFEDKTTSIDPPHVYTSSIFQEHLIDEWKTRQKYDQEVSDTESIATFPISSHFDPEEMIKRALDFDSVIQLLKDEITNIRRTIPSEYIQSLIEKGKLIEKLMEISDSNNSKSEKNNSIKLTPPFSWLHNFASSCPKQSFNFIEIPSTPLVSECADSDFEFSIQQKERCISAESNQTIIRLSTPDSVDSIKSRCMINQILADVICKLNEAISCAKCSVRDVKSVESVIEQEFGDDVHAMKLTGYLKEADKNGVEFNDLNELNNYFMSEVVKESKHGLDCCKEITEVDQKNSSIVQVFGDSGIEVDNRMLEKRVSDTMILGLVQKPEITDNLEQDKIEIESVKSTQNDDMTTTEDNVREENIQTMSLPEKSEELKQLDVSEDEMRKTVIPVMPGIGRPISKDTIENFLHYLMFCSRIQGGMVYPRNWQDTECPPMTDGN